MTRTITALLTVLLFIPGKADPWEGVARAPQSAAVVVAWDLGGKVDLLPFWRLALKVDQDSLPEERLEWEGMLREAGFTLEEWLASFSGSGRWLYRRAPSAHQWEFELGPGTTLARRLQQRFGGQGESFQKEAGSELALVCDDSEMTLRLGPPFKDQKTLGADPAFRRAQEKLGSSPCDLLLYWPGGPSGRGFAALTFDFRRNEVNGFCSLPNDSLPPHGIDSGLLASRPPQLQTFLALDLQWFALNFKKLSASLPLPEGVKSFLAARQEPGGLLQTFTGQGLMGTTDTPAALLTGVSAQATFYATGRYLELGSVEQFLADLEYQARLDTLQGCEANLDQLAWFLARWEVDLKRPIPSDLQALVPELLPSLPICPSAGRSTYQASKNTNEGRVVFCRGHHHPQTLPDYPRFSQTKGADRGEFQAPTDLPSFSRVEANGRASYHLSSGQRLRVDSKDKTVSLADGPLDEQFLTPGEPQALPESAATNLSWGQSRLIYLDHFDLASGMRQLKESAAVPYPGTLEFLTTAFLEGVRQADTTQASNALRWDPDGLSYRGTGLWGSPVVLSPLAGLSVAIQSTLRRQEQAKAFECRENLALLGRALEAYARDHQGAFPSRLGELSPTYLGDLPRCPAAGADTYSTNYLSDRYEKWNSASSFCSVRCQGDYHRKAGWASDEPVYSSETGLYPPLDQR